MCYGLLLAISAPSDKDGLFVLHTVTSGGGGMLLDTVIVTVSQLVAQPS